MNNFHSKLSQIANLHNNYHLALYIDICICTIDMRGLRTILNKIVQNCYAAFWMGLERKKSK